MFKNPLFVFTFCLIAIGSLYLIYTSFQDNNTNNNANNHSNTKNKNNETNETGVIETWQPYRECPLGNYEMAPENAVYFPQTRYRLPYQYPRKFESSYPVPHMRHYEDRF